MPKKKKEPVYTVSATVLHHSFKGGGDTLEGAVTDILSNIPDERMRGMFVFQKGTNSFKRMLFASYLKHPIKGALIMKSIRTNIG